MALLFIDNSNIKACFAYVYEAMLLTCASPITPASEVTKNESTPNLLGMSTIDEDVLKEILQDCPKSLYVSESVSPASTEVRNIQNRKRKREDAEQDIAETQREILREIKNLVLIQKELLDEMKIRNNIECQKLALQQCLEPLPARLPIDVAVLQDNEYSNT